MKIGQKITIDISTHIAP